MNRLILLAALTLISSPAVAGDYQPGKYKNANDVMYTQPWNRTGNTGVMMVPYASNTTGDYAEQTLYLSSGEMAPINRVYAPTDGADMISKLGKLQQMQNKSVDLLVISGHA